MGVLSAVEGLRGEGTHSFLNPQGRAVVPQTDRGWQRRNATFTVMNKDFGTSPFGMGVAPTAPRMFDWECSVVYENSPIKSYDAATDDLNAVLGQGRPVRLVWQHDEGFERVTVARCEGLKAPFTTQSQFVADFTVTFELNDWWTERSSVDESIRCGQVPPIFCGQTPTIYCGQGVSTQAITAPATGQLDFAVPTSIVDASVGGPGGVPTHADKAPTFTFYGPLGGTDGFVIANTVDSYGQEMANAPGLVGVGFTYDQFLPSGYWLEVMPGSWRARLHHATDSTDVWRAHIQVPDTQPYAAAILPGVRNQYRLRSLGTSQVYSGTVAIGWRRLWL